MTRVFGTIAVVTGQGVDLRREVLAAVSDVRPEHDGTWHLESESVAVLFPREHVDEEISYGLAVKVWITAGAGGEDHVLGGACLAVEPELQGCPALEDPAGRRIGGEARGIPVEDDEATAPGQNDVGVVGLLHQSCL